MIRTLYHWAGLFRNTAFVLTRVCIGWIFIQSGWGKLNNLEKIVGFFTSLGIPMPQVQAPMVALIEFIGGLLILVGFATRVTAIPLIVIMMVALKTAHWGDVKTFGDLFGQDVFLYALLLIWLVGHGPGPLSVDQFTLEKKYRAR